MSKNKKIFYGILAIVVVIAAVVVVYKIVPLSTSLLLPPEVETTNQSGSTTDKIECEKAETALKQYFELLSSGQYEKAVHYHGSGYGYIKQSCPLIDHNNQIELLECGCRFLVCEPIHRIVDKTIINEKEFIFNVQFIYSDGALKGTLVKSYPYCCGQEPPPGEENIPKTEFKYTVKKVGDNFFIMSPLLYIP